MKKQGNSFILLFLSNNYNKLRTIFRRVDEVLRIQEAKDSSLPAGRQGFE